MLRFVWVGGGGLSRLGSADLPPNPIYCARDSISTHAPPGAVPGLSTRGRPGAAPGLSTRGRTLLGTFIKGCRCQCLGSIFSWHIRQWEVFRPHATKGNWDSNMQCPPTRQLQVWVWGQRRLDWTVTGLQHAWFAPWKGEVTWTPSVTPTPTPTPTPPQTGTPGLYTMWKHDMHTPRHLLKVPTV